MAASHEPHTTTHAPALPARYPRHAPGGEVPGSIDLPALEERVLAYWRRDDTFRASVARRASGHEGNNEFVFYDGPPFANGLPHYGHLLTGYAKDVVGRFQTQLGHRVERRFGWDTHGLPAELETEQELGITDKSQIDAMGIEAFNKACEDSVLRYTHEWQDYVTRQARWVDFDNDYKTLDVTYMESVIWAFKRLYDKGLTYEGFRVLPYCWQDETPLSNHELRMDDDVYQMRQDPAVTVGFRLETGELALIWTTTPWTLPSNLLLIVGQDIEYVIVESEASGTTERYVLAEARLEAYARELAGGDVEALRARIVERLTGADLIGRRYTPPFSYYLGHAHAHRIVADDYVTTAEGTGLVHSAGAFGEDDMATTDREGIEPVMPVGPDGCFTSPVTDYAGLQVFEANPHIINHLKAATRQTTSPLAPAAGEQVAPSTPPDSGEGAGSPRGSVSEGTVLLRHETYDHSYPHCWRCGSALIYRGVSSWFVAVSTFRDRMVELNEQINWVPEHIKHGQFGNWLSGARDWSISRNRYWGTPIPVWLSDDETYPRIDVYGSLAELEADFGHLPVDREGNINLHRPFVDELTRPNPDDPTGRSTMQRIPDLLDVWFDSGSMPFAQVHYPFDNAEWFSRHYPGDFIVEYIGQTRGWFYTLHVLATALFDRPAFRNCVSHGVVLGFDGRKMSKSLRNYPNVDEVFDRDGSDAMRWFLMASPILRGGNLIVTEEGIREGVRQVLLPVWNTWYFLALYAGAANGGQGTVGRHVLPEEVATYPVMDRYVLARTGELANVVAKRLGDYDISGACTALREHIDVLTNWYVRTSRHRFWDEDEQAINTLHTTLEVLMRVMAPLAPLLSEEVWRGLTGQRSVHLSDWPRLAAEFADDPLVARMDRVREIVSATLGMRKAAGLRVRQPLRRLRVMVTDPSDLHDVTGLIASEVNVKQVELLDATGAAAADFGMRSRLTINARAAGPRLGKDVQGVIRAAREGNWHPVAGGTVVANGIELTEDEYTLSTEVVAAEGEQTTAAILDDGGLIVLDTALDDELRAEGYARDVVRQVQEERKAAGLHVADRIVLRLVAPAGYGPWLAAHTELIGAETLATEVHLSEDGQELGIELEEAIRP